MGAMGAMGGRAKDRTGRAAGTVWATGALAAVPLILAHVAISLLVLSPRAGQTVAPDTDAVIVAQRTLGGVDDTTFTTRLDGERVGGTVGIRVGDSVTVPLPRMAPGPHRLEIDYRPDLDEPSRTATVDFEVTGAGAGSQGLLDDGLVRLLVVVAAIVLAVGGGLLLRRRARSSRPPSRPRAAGS